MSVQALCGLKMVHFDQARKKRKIHAEKYPLPNDYVFENCIFFCEKFSIHTINIFYFITMQIQSIS